MRGPLAIVALVSLSAAIGLVCAPPAAAQAPRPNILIIVTDDQRATNTLGVMPKTMRYFLDGGTRYTNAYATTPLCCPSRATILTGRYAHNTGIHTNGSVQGLDVETLFPRLLQLGGYRTALVGKFLNSWPSELAPPYFNRWALGGVYVNPTFNVNGTAVTRSGYGTTWTRRYSLRFLRSFEAEDASPWFLYVGTHAPHHPWRAEARYADAPISRWRGNPAVFEEDRSDKPPYLQGVYKTIEQGRAVRKGQLRTLMSVDDMVGGIFRTLRELGEARNTLAVFVSDNGFLWADHHFGGARGTAGQKRVPYTASVKVPFLLRWPRHVTPGVRETRLTGTVDIAPTVLAAAGIGPDPSKPPLDGRSLFEPDARSRILLEYWGMEAGIPTWASLRTKTFQYIENYADDGTTPTFLEYYDLLADPWQLENLYADVDPSNDPSAKLTAQLSAQLAADRACAGMGPDPGTCP